ncbi:TPA: hypothetical protein PTV74_003358 [Clostridium botulinum]|nr:hypothetical protein [Clostridium botulinum]HDK7206510.1 hypothetical protein [Clostridium botulinum]HDK7210245.1 hypothetical protein [Clostridium botulinum]HDK7265695.1 hypothetical protein [Clostridium botulinum]HDK7269542.1 hypothetical protein [Clostridium botulinum]
MRSNDYDDFIKYVVDKFENEENISFICDYDLANILMCEFGNRDYELKHIDITNERNGYYVSKIEEKFFCIEPMKEENEIKMTISDYFIIDGNILEKNPTLFNYLEGNDFKVEIIDYEEDCCCNNCCEYCSEYEATEEDKMDLDELFGGNSIKEEIEEKDLVYVFANLIAEYTGLILDNDCQEEVIGHALTEFGFKILEKVYLDEA